jgi:1,4-alpha-glucan branching enzyme
MVATKNRTAEFTFYRPNAKRVFLVGDFNGWKPNDLPLMRGENGYWRGVVKLPPGTFRFRYLADGQWFVDYAAFGLLQGPFGPDSVVRIDG